MMSFRNLAAVGGLLSLIASGTDARAGDDLVEAEDAVFREAVKAAAKEDWATCRTKAAGVWHTNKNPTVAALLGSCEAELGLNRDAAEHLDFFLQRDDGKRPVQTQAANKRFPKVRAKVMLVEVASQPAAEVRVDGTVIGTAPARVFLDPGSHSIELRQLGFVSKTESVTATAGGSQKLDVKLETEHGGGGGAGGAGGSGGAPGTTTSTGAGGGEDTSSNKPAWPAVVMGGIGAAGLATGIALLVVGTNKHGDAEDIAACRPWTSDCEAQVNDSLDEGEGLRGGGIAAVSVGGASLIGMILYLAIPSSSDSEQAVRLVPLSDPTATGLMLRGTF